MKLAAEVALRTVPMLWLGMVLAISVLEAPLKFRAPGVTLEIGLGIGRLVFHALNAVELGLAALLAITLVALASGSGAAGAGPLATAAIALAIALLLAQVLVLRPVLDARLEARLAGDQLAASWHHIAYIALEGVKLLALGAAGIAIALAGRDG